MYNADFCAVVFVKVEIVLMCVNVGRCVVSVANVLEIVFEMCVGVRKKL